MPSGCVAYPFDMAPFSDGIKNEASDKNYVFRSAGDNLDPNDKAPNMGVPQPYGLMFLAP